MRPTENVPCRAQISIPIRQPCFGPVTGSRCPVRERRCLRLPARLGLVCLPVALGALVPLSAGTSGPAAQSRQTTTAQETQTFRSCWPSGSALGALQTARAHLAEGALDDAVREFELSRDRAISARDADVEGWAWLGLSGVAYRRSQFLASRAASERAARGAEALRELLRLVREAGDTGCWAGCSNAPGRSSSSTCGTMGVVSVENTSVPLEPL